MKQLTSILAAGTLLAACATTSFATTEGPLNDLTGVSYTLTDWTGSLVFPQFDPSLGSLISVELNISSSLSTSLEIQNSSDSASSGSANTEVQVTVQDSGLNLVAPFDVYSASYNYSLAAGGSIGSGILTGSGGNDETYTAAPILLEFTEGSGSISLNASTFTQTLLANTGGNTDASQVTDADLSGTVTYVYTVVPEPTTLALAGLSGFSLLLFLRQRK